MNLASLIPPDRRSGKRIATERFARVIVPGKGRWLGMITDVSLSGGYLRMVTRPELASTVSIQPVASSKVLRGVVSRVDETGVAVEWLAPQVQALQCLTGPANAP